MEGFGVGFPSPFLGGMKHRVTWSNKKGLLYKVFVGAFCSGFLEESIGEQWV